MINTAIESDQLQQYKQAVDTAEWVSTSVRLAELCRVWRQSPRVAVDTEFHRTDTFYPIPGLIQIGCDDQIFLIDPKAIDDFSPFAELLSDQSVLKLIHAGSEDLELFAHCYGATPQPVFDTQTACAFLGLGLSIGYQRLLGTLFGLEVDKHETRSDWLQRPLTESQLRYAAEDVVYLEAVYQRLAPRLETEGKMAWVLEECQQASDAALAEPDMERYYLRFKQAWKLNPNQLGVLQALSGWREIQARERNIPRNFVVHNSTLQSIAMLQPSHKGALAKAEKIRGRTLFKDGAQILELVEQGQEMARAGLLDTPPRPLPARCAGALKQLKKLVQQRAESLQIAPEILARRKDLEALLIQQQNEPERSAKLPAGLQGWRAEVVGQLLLQALSEPAELET